jgi:2-keto-4-pentenoate hydratase/2-oxohepta-3-ene-1,7-dioic acid hydratase in catechol pathway
MPAAIGGNVRWVWNEGERQVVDAADVDGIAASIDLDPPVEHVRMVWAIGLNYRDHAAETGAPIPTEPVVFVKSTGSVVGHGADIMIPPHVTQPDYEGELAVVIGHRARDVPADEAMDVIEGVTCAHDVSSRDHQFTTGQWVWSKSFDTFCPLGPALVTADELDLGHLDIETRVNGETLQSSNTDQLVFDVPQLIAHLSQGLTLEPGDVILTGTPGGVGMARSPQRWLEDGDVVEITIAGIGTLRNRVIRR